MIDIMNELEHSAKGTTWGKHKYIRIENGRYIYSETDKEGKTTSRDATIAEIHDRLKNFKLTKGGKSSSSSKKSSSEKKESSGKSSSAKEKNTSESSTKSSTSSKSSTNDEKKIQTSNNEYLKGQYRDEEYEKEVANAEKTYNDAVKEKQSADEILDRLRKNRKTKVVLEMRGLKHFDEYDGVILKPAMDDILEHHGIIGRKIL